MKPLELSSVAAVWNSALTILTRNLKDEGDHLQLWFPWGKTWRGHDTGGILPPTDLPGHLTAQPSTRFAGRIWHSIKVADTSWLISLKLHGTATPPGEIRISDEASTALHLLSEFVKLECLLGLSLRILENRANERTGHWDRVRNFCVAMGHQMKFTGRDLFELELAGLLHDIGKVTLPPALLEESRPLSPAERRQIETHSTIGAGMIREIPGMERIAEYVLLHHEAPDGSGYPKNLKSEEIPLNSLIIGAADAFDAMTHYRPYASEQTYKETIDEMLKSSGKFDHRVLWALQEVLRDLGIMDVHPGSPGESPASSNQSA